MSIYIFIFKATNTFLYFNVEILLLFTITIKDTVRFINSESIARTNWNTKYDDLEHIKKARNINDNGKLQLHSAVTNSSSLQYNIISLGTSG